MSHPNDRARTNLPLQTPVPILGQKPPPPSPSYEGVAIMAGGNVVFQFTVDPDKLTDKQASRLARRARRLLFEFATGETPVPETD